MASIKNQLEKIQSNKTKNRNSLLELKNKYLFKIYDGLSNGKNYTKIHKELLEMTINSKVYSKVLFTQAVNTLKRAKKKIDQPDVKILGLAGMLVSSTITNVNDAKSLVLYDFLDKSKVNTRMEQTISVEVRKEEGEEKENTLKEDLKENIEQDIPIIFYLASEHNDSASDHKPYQGKIYIHEDWKSFVKDENLRAEINKYIQTHGTKTVQWVMGAPVWFITRPNCRHYFKQIKTEDVLQKSVKELIKENDMHRKIGRRRYIQTLKHPNTPEWYKDFQNAQSLLNKYIERLHYHKGLYREHPNDLLKQAIMKDKMLIKKWRDYLQTLK